MIGAWTFPTNRGHSTTPLAGDLRVEFVYDYMGRRVRKTTYEWDEGDGMQFPPIEPGWSEFPVDDRTFVYDGWNVVLEQQGTFGSGAEPSIAKYAWGLDLSGLNSVAPVSNRWSSTSSAVHGAGGIGGLLAMEGAHLPDYAEYPKFAYFYDGNGNVGQLVTFDGGTPAPPPAVTPMTITPGDIAARYEYDPYGGTLVASDDFGLENPFRFSTKYYDTQPGAAAAGERGLYYYGYRYYSPRLGRWMTRDPIGEWGGYALAEFAANSPNGLVDSLGLKPGMNYQSGGGIRVSKVTPSLGGCGASSSATIILELALDFIEQYDELENPITSIFGVTQQWKHKANKFTWRYNKAIGWSCEPKLLGIVPVCRVTMQNGNDWESLSPPDAPYDVSWNVVPSGAMPHETRNSCKKVRIEASVSVQERSKLFPQAGGSAGGVGGFNVGGGIAQGGGVGAALVGFGKPFHSSIDVTLCCERCGCLKCKPKFSMGAASNGDKVPGTP